MSAALALASCVAALAIAGLLHYEAAATAAAERQAPAVEPRACIHTLAAPVEPGACIHALACEIDGSCEEVSS